MATTTNYSWTTPDDTALVKDGASAIRALGTAIDTSMNTALGTKKAGMVLLNTTSFSAVASQSINDVFSTTYDNYFMIADISGSTAGGMSIRMRVGGTDTTTGYARQYVFADNTSVSGARVTGLGSWGALDYNSTSRSTGLYTFVNPFKTVATAIHSFRNAKYPITQTVIYDGYGLDNATSYTGFTLIGDAGTMTGSVSVYGYNK